MIPLRRIFGFDAALVERRPRGRAYRKHLFNSQCLYSAPSSSPTGAGTAATLPNCRRISPKILSFHRFGAQDGPMGPFFTSEITRIAGAKQIGRARCASLGNAIVLVDQGSRANTIASPVAVPLGTRAEANHERCAMAMRQPRYKSRF